MGYIATATVYWALPADSLRLSLPDNKSHANPRTDITTRLMGLQRSSWALIARDLTWEEICRSEARRN